MRPLQKNTTRTLTKAVVPTLIGEAGLRPLQIGFCHTASAPGGIKKQKTRPAILQLQGGRIYCIIGYSKPS